MKENSIKKYRLKRGMTQEELAEKLGVNRVSISYWERGLSLPKGSRLLDVSTVLGVSVDKLLRPQT